jgi:DNA-binding FrmR family transcriptional regulator
MVKLHTKKDRTLHRLKIIKGQLEKMIKMVEKDEYCISVLHNSLSVQKALKTIDMLIMEDHLKTCAIHQAQNGESDKLVSELLSIYKFK